MLTVHGHGFIGQMACFKDDYFCRPILINNHKLTTICGLKYSHLIRKLTLVLLLCSGHGLSGLGTLNILSFVAVPAMFAGGMATAAILDVLGHMQQ